MENIFDISNSFADAQSSMKKGKQDMLALREQLKSIPEDAVVTRSKLVEQINAKAAAYKKVEAVLEEKRKYVRSIVSSGDLGKLEPSIVPGRNEIRPLDYTPPTKEQIMKEALSVGYNIPKEKLDFESGIDDAVRYTAALQRPEIRGSFYKQQFGQENVIPIPMSGGENYLVRNGDKWVMADEFGTTWQDVRELGVVGIKEGIGIGVNIATGIVTRGLGTTTMATTGAAAEGGAMSFLDRSLGQLAFDGRMPESTGDTVERRMKESAIGAGLEITQYQLLKPLLKRVGGKSFASREVKETVESLDQMVADGSITKKDKRRVLGLLAMQDNDLKRAAYYASKDQTKMVPSAYSRAQQIIEEFQNGVKKAGPESGRLLYTETVQNAAKANRQFISHVRKYDEELARLLEKDRADAFTSVGGTIGRSTQMLDNRFSEMVQNQRALDLKAKNDSFGQLYEKSDNDGIKLSRLELAAFLRRAMIKEPALNNSGVEKIIARYAEDPEVIKGRIGKLQKKIKSAKTPESRELIESEIALEQTKLQPLTLKQIRDVYREVSEAAPEGFSIKPTGAAAQAMKVSEEVSELFEDIVSAAGLKADWDLATQKYQRYLDSTSGVFKRILALDDAGRQKLTEKGMTNLMLSDPQYIKDAYDNLYKGSPDAARSFMEMAQRAYLDKQAARGFGTVNELQFDEDTVRVLYGYGENGLNELYGENAVRNFYALNEKLKKLNIDPRHIDINDLDSLRGALSKNRVDEVVRFIELRAKYLQKQESLKNTKLLGFASDAIRNGDFSGVHAGVLPDVILRAKGPKDQKAVKMIFDLLPDSERKILRDDTMKHFFEHYAVTESSVNTPYLPWNYKAFLRDISSNESFRNNLKVVIGESDLQKLINHSRMAKRFDIDPIKGSRVGIRGTVTEKGFAGYLSGSVTDEIARHMMGPMYGTGQLFRILGDGTDSTVTREIYLNRLSKLNYIAKAFPMVAKPSSLVQQFRHDPDMMQLIGDSFKKDLEEDEE